VKVLSGKQLKLHRIMKDMKVTEIAEMIGVHYTYISKLEKEVQKIPIHIYSQWVKVLNIK
jgi:transcriptional regulator with XRE-family HTH domain